MTATGPTMTADEFIESKAAAFAKDLEAGRLLIMKDIDRQGFHLWRREAWTFLVETGLPTKVFVFERLTFAGTRGRRRTSTARAAKLSQPVTASATGWSRGTAGRLGGGGGLSSRG